MKSKSSPFLSKTKYLEGLKCPKLLWYEYNRKEELPPVDARAQAVMDQGTIVGELAQTLFPGGIKLERAYEPEKQAEQSLKAARLRKPLFEAGFINERAYALADILNPVGKNVWDLIEVKSSTSAKDEYLQDVAFQKYVINQTLPQYEVSAYLMMADKSSMCPTEGLNQKFRLVKDHNGRKTVSVSDSLTEADLTPPILCKVNVDKECEQLYAGTDGGNNQSLSTVRQIDYCYLLIWEYSLYIRKVVFTGFFIQQVNSCNIGSCLL